MEHEDDNEDHSQRWKSEMDRLDEALTIIHTYMFNKLQAGAAGRAELRTADKAFNDVVIRRGGVSQLANDAVSVSLMRHGLHAMRERLKEMFPDESDVIAKLGQSPSPDR